MRQKPFCLFVAPALVGVSLFFAACGASAQDDPLGALIQQKTAEKAIQSQSAAPAAAAAAAAHNVQGATQTIQSLNPADAKAALGAAAAGQLGQTGATTGGSLGAAAGALGAGGLAGGALSSLNLPSLFGGSAGNVAGVLQYCVQNNYLNKAKANASAIKDGLLKVAGLEGSPAPESSNTNYANGLAGLLFGGDGGTFDLNQVQSNLKEKACDYVLEQAPSLL